MSEIFSYKLQLVNIICVILLFTQICKYPIVYIEKDEIYTFKKCNSLQARVKGYLLQRFLILFIHSLPSILILAYQQYITLEC